jgi:hypothetical protein
LHLHSSPVASPGNPRDLGRVECQAGQTPYGQAALEVTRGHHSQPIMVAALIMFAKDLAREVERVGGIKKKGIARHNADRLNAGVPQPTEDQEIFGGLPEIGLSVNYDRIIRSNSNKYLWMVTV